MRVNIGMPVVRTDGRSVGHVITKFSGMGRFIYPWCSAGARSAPVHHLCVFGWVYDSFFVRAELHPNGQSGCVVM